MSDECDCPCPGQPEQPSRSSSGKALETSGGGTQTIALAGSVGKNGQGDPVLRHAGINPKTGALLVETTETPHGADGTLVIDNATLVLRNGRILSISTPGSGLVTFTPATA